MTVRVEPAQLDAYAGQLERNSELFVSPLRDYCAEHCGHTEGMTGLLAAAKPVVDLARETTAALCASGERNLFQVATNLRAAATNYRHGDEAAAEKIWLVLPRQRAPRDYEDHNDPRHSGDFRDPFVPRLNPPAQRDDFRHAVEEAKQHIGVVDTWLHRYAHFSLGEQVLPWISGDWATLRENADGYAELAGANGVPVIAQNLAYGMDSLSTSWDSAAATQFAFTVRDRWVPAIEALRHLLELHREQFEWMAQQSENTLHALVILVEVLKCWVIEKVLRIIKIAGTLTGLGTVWKEIMELISNVLKIWHEITMLFEMLELALKGALEMVQVLGAEATVIEDLWLAPGENRFNPITVG